VQVKREEAANIKQDVRKVGFKSQDKSALYAKKIQWEVIYIPINWWNLLGFFFHPKSFLILRKKFLGQTKKNCLSARRKNHEQNRYW